MNLKAKMKVENLLPIESNEQQLCFKTVTEKQKEHSISEIIDSLLQNKVWMLTINENKKLAKLLIKYKLIISS